LELRTALAAFFASGVSCDGKYDQAFGAAIHDLDGAEIVHPLVYARSERATELRDFYQRGKAISPELVAVGSSDYH
jgi:hypothetical protein